jgi:hypothetical protein
MKKPVKKTITELRSSLFETFEDVVSGNIHVVSHKNGSEIALVPVDIIEDLQNEIVLHKNLSIGYAQALRDEGISSDQLRKKIKTKEKALRKKFA